MYRVCPALLAGLLVWSGVGPALAVDRPIDASRLVIKRGGAGQKLVFLSKDPAALFPAIGSADDPSSAGATVELFTAGEGPATISLPAGSGNPGWRASANAPSHTFTNSLAPGGPSPVRQAVLKQSRLLRIVSRGTGLPLTSPLGAIGIRITTGTQRNCALFDATTIKVDEAGRFTAAGAHATSLADCSDVALGAPPTTTTTTGAPTCGNGIVEAGEACDGAAQGSCFGDSACGAPGTPVACQCCAESGTQCGALARQTLPCCDAVASCTVQCSPELPMYCMGPPTFPGCNMTGTWYEFRIGDGYTSEVFFIVEGAGGALGVVRFTYPNFDDYQVGTASRSGNVVTGAISDTLVSCDVLGTSTQCGGFVLVRASPRVCGDGTISPELEEQCDDGNQGAGDCCSPACQVEAGCP